MAVPGVGRRRVQGALTALDRSVLAGPTLEAARRLLGARLVRAADSGGESRIGRIVEVEAYIGTDDLASHARFGRTARNAVMFGPPGTAYVYLVYGMYDCLNVVTEPDGRPAAVLIRAVEPIAGVDAIRRARIERALLRRAAATPDGAAAAERRIGALPVSALCAGPALVTAGFSLTRADTGVDLLDPGSPVRIEAPAPRDRAVELRSGPRVGIDYAAEPWRNRPWRLWDASSPAVTHGPARRTR